MTNHPDVPGLRLSALPPVYEFTNHSDYVFAAAAVFLMQHDSEPHWFATDGYSAMLTPAVIEDQDADRLFETAVQERCYRPEHVKALFRHVKHGTVIYNPETGTLTSPDGIMIVPPYVLEAAEGKDEEPELVRVPEGYQDVFSGEEVQQGTFEFGWKFVTAIRAAFKANSKDADLTMVSLGGSRVLLRVAEPYQGQVLIALKREAEKPHGADDALN